MDMKTIKEYEKLQLQTNDLNSVENFNIRPGGEIKIEEPIINKAEEELNINYQRLFELLYPWDTLKLNDNTLDPAINEYKIQKFEITMNRRLHDRLYNRIVKYLKHEFDVHDKDLKYLNNHSLLSPSSNEIRAVSRLRIRLYHKLDIKRIREDEIKKLLKEEEIIKNELIKSGNKGRMFERLTDFVEDVKEGKNIEENFPPYVELENEKLHKGISKWKSTFNKRQWYGLKESDDPNKNKIQTRRMIKLLPNIQLPARYGNLSDWIEWYKRENKEIGSDIYLASDIEPLTKEEVEIHRNNLIGKKNLLNNYKVSDNIQREVEENGIIINSPKFKGNMGGPMNEYLYTSSPEYDYFYMDEIIYNSIPKCNSRLIYKYPLNNKNNMCENKECVCNKCIFYERHNIERDAESIFETTHELFDKYCENELYNLNDFGSEKDVKRMLSYKLELYPDYDLHHLTEKPKPSIVWKDERPIKYVVFNPKELLDILKIEYTPILTTISNNYKNIMKSPQYRVQKGIPMEYLKRMEVLFRKLSMPRQQRVHYLSQFSGQNFSYSVQYCIQSWEKALINIMQREKLMLKIKKLVEEKEEDTISSPSAITQKKFEIWTFIKQRYIPSVNVCIDDTIRLYKMFKIYLSLGNSLYLDRLCSDNDWIRNRVDFTLDDVTKEVLRKKEKEDMIRKRENEKQAKLLKEQKNKNK